MLAGISVDCVVRLEQGRARCRRRRSSERSPARCGSTWRAATNCSTSRGPRVQTAQAGGRRSHTKTVHHREPGAIVLDCDTLHVPDVDRSVLVYSAAPDTPAAEAPALLRALGPGQWNSDPASS